MRSCQRARIGRCPAAVHRGNVLRATHLPLPRRRQTTDHRRAERSNGGNRRVCAATAARRSYRSSALYALCTVRTPRRSPSEAQRGTPATGGAGVCGAARARTWRVPRALGGLRPARRGMGARRAARPAGARVPRRVAPAGGGRAPARGGRWPGAAAMAAPVGCRHGPCAKPETRYQRLPKADICPGMGGQGRITHDSVIPRPC